MPIARSTAVVACGAMWAPEVHFRAGPGGALSARDTIDIRKSPAPSQIIQFRASDAVT
jgi:hypothetical protein